MTDDAVVMELRIGKKTYRFNLVGSANTRTLTAVDERGPDGMAETGNDGAPRRIIGVGRDGSIKRER